MNRIKLAWAVVAAVALSMGSAGAQAPANDNTQSGPPGSNIKQPTKPGMDNGITTRGAGSSSTRGTGSGSGAPGNEPTGKPPAMGGHESGMGGVPAGAGAGGVPGGPGAGGTPGSGGAGGLPEGAPR